MKAWKGFTAAEEAMVAQLYANGRTIAQIAEILGRRTSSVYVVLVRSGIPRRHHWSKLPKTETTKILELRRQGLSQSQVARVLGVSKGRISGVCHRHGGSAP